MTIFVLGVRDSGKSALAEKLAQSIGGGRKYYLATMKVSDEESRERVIRHRRQREGCGFITIEKEYGISETLNLMDDPEDSTVLLECVANLVGNMMHGIPNTMWLIGLGDVGLREFVTSVTERVTSLAGKVRDMIVVTSEYEPDPADDEETALYKKLLDMVNTELVKKADVVRRT